MKISVNVFDPNIKPIEEIIDSYRTDSQAYWVMTKDKLGLPMASDFQFRYVVSELEKNSINKYELAYYGICFMLDRISKGDIDVIADIQKLSASFNTIIICGINDTALVKEESFVYGTGVDALLASLGKLLRLNNCTIKCNDSILGSSILVGYILNESDEFIKYVLSHKMEKVSFDLNIYWSLRFNKIKANFTNIIDDSINFGNAFNMYLLDTQLPTASMFKEEYSKVKNNYISITSVLKNWKRKNKKLLSCYINEDEKQYLEYMLLSNTVNYKELKQFVYGK